MNRLLRREEGQALPFVVISLVVLLGFAALAVDVGNVLLHKRRLQAATDFGVLAGSQKLPNTGVAGTDATAFARDNWQRKSVLPVGTTITTGCQNAGCEAPDKITLNASTDVPTYFAKLFGIDSVRVRAKGSACGPCDTSIKKFDVMVVLDRSYSMCLDSNNAFNNCYDLENAREGIRSLLGFFNPTHDRVGLAVLSSGDSNSPFSSTGAAFPCDGVNVGDSGTNTFYRTAGDFMDGTPANHDNWVLASLESNFKRADGSLNPSSRLVSTIGCLRSKLWTPIAPAIQAAKDELVLNGRTDPAVKKIMVFLGDGGGNTQPMVRTAAGAATATPSWYTPSPGNNLRPCRDAVGQAAIAKQAGIEVFTIGYDLNTSTSSSCYRDNRPSTSGYLESGINATSALQQMATNSDHFYNKATPGELYAIFNAIGRQITSGGSRLIE